MNVIDHKKQARSRVYAQYKSKPKFMDWISINGDLGNEIESVYQNIASSYDIDNAGTNELDILGRIVDINRSFEGVVKTDAFLFGSGAQYGGLTQFRTGDGSGSGLTNDIFRLLIKSKISKNIGDATLDGIITSLGFMIKTSNIQIIDNEDMTFSLVFDKLEGLEKIVLTTFDIIPKPQGVRFTGYLDYSSVPQFGRNQLGGYTQYAYRYEA